MRAVRVLAIGLAVVALLAASGCGTRMPRGGFRESTGGDRWEAEFGAWDGTEAQELGVEGERSIRFSYRADITEGRVIFVMRNASGESVWELTADEAVDDTEEIPLSDPGEYEVTAYGTNATGEFDLSWEAR